MSLFRPRAREEIHTERIYLNAAIQSHSNHLYGLFSAYHKAEDTSIHGESRRVKRQARRQIGILRSQIRYAAEQEKTMFVRLSELHVEAKSREVRDLMMRLSRGPEGVENMVRPLYETRQNRAMAGFAPQSESSNIYGEEVPPSYTQSPDPEDAHDDTVRRHAAKHGVEPHFEPNHCEPNHFIQNRSRSEGSCPARLKSRRYSLPDIASEWPAN